MSAKKSKNNSSELEEFIKGLVYIYMYLINLLAWIVFKIITVSYDYISYRKSGYKGKSGISFLKMYFDKGYYGEFSFYRKVIKIFKKENVLTNVYLDNKNTEKTEIDVLAVSNKAVYVFEIKNYSGYIYGSESDVNWTKAFNKRTKHKFYNPLRQNYAHSKAIENCLNIDASLIIPVVIFSNKSKLKKINVAMDKNVFQFRDGLKFVKNIERQSKTNFSDELVSSFLVKLYENCNMPDIVKQKHIEEVQALREQQVETIN